MSKPKAIVRQNRDTLSWRFILVDERGVSLFEMPWRAQKQAALDDRAKIVAAAVCAEYSTGVGT